MDVLDEALAEIQNKNLNDEVTELSNDEIIAELIKNQREHLENKRKLFHGRLTTQRC